MRDLIREYGAAVAARVELEREAWLESHPEAGQPLRDARTAETAALEALEDARRHAAQLVAQAIPEVEAIAAAAPQVYADDPRYTEGYRANFDRPHNARRPFTMKDAKPLARVAARHLREAWELLDPTLRPFR